MNNVIHPEVVTGREALAESFRSAKFFPMP